MNLRIWQQKNEEKQHLHPEDLLQEENHLLKDQLLRGEKRGDKFL